MFRIPFFGRTSIRIHLPATMQIIERTRVFNGHYKVNQLIVQDGDVQLKREQFAPGKAVAALVYDTAR